MNATQITLLTINEHDSLQRFKAAITADEWQQCLGFKTLLLQHRYAMSRATLRQQLSQKIGVAPLDLSFTFNAYKKPHLQSNAQDWHFSISHSENITAIAVAAAPVGIDIEQTNNTPNKKIIPLFIRDDESLQLKSEPESEIDFYQLWCVKEAVLKAMGTGFYTNPLDVRLCPLATDFFAAYKDHQCYVARSCLVRPDLQLAISQLNTLTPFFIN